MSAYALLVGICHVVLGCVIAWRLAGRVAYRRGFVDGYRYVPKVLDDTKSADHGDRSAALCGNPKHPDGAWHPCAAIPLSSDWRARAVIALHEEWWRCGCPARLRNRSGMGDGRQFCDAISAPHASQTNKPPTDLKPVT